MADIIAWITLLDPIVGVLGATIAALGYILRRKFRSDKRDKIQLLEMMTQVQKDHQKIEAELNKATSQLPSVALRNFENNKKQNPQEAYHNLYDWFRQQAPDHGQVAAVLAAHFAQYVEPELVQDATEKAKELAIIALNEHVQRPAMTGLLRELDFLQLSTEPSVQGRQVDIFEHYLPVLPRREAEAHSEALGVQVFRLIDEGRYQLTQMAAARWVEFVKRQLSVDHIHVFGSLTALWRAQQVQGDPSLLQTLDEAEEYFNRYPFKADWPVRFAMGVSRARALIDAGRNEEAAIILRDLEDSAERHRGDAAYSVFLRAKAELAWDEDLDEAIAGFRKSADHEVARASPDIFALAVTRFYLARALCSKGSFEEAKSVLEESLRELANGLWCEGHPENASNQILLAVCLAGLGQRDAAAELAITKYREQESAVGKGSPRLMVEATMVAEALVLAGQHEKAEDILNEIVLNDDPSEITIALKALIANEKGFHEAARQLCSLLSDKFFVRDTFLAKLLQRVVDKALPSQANTGVNC